ncbi:pyruvate dehydrogenase E1 component beta subunit [Crenobacter luteus]|uniref:2-oxoisovalerate dehydrogenase n=1 Tax=Crenobacter luteus TaxID=1452487 RepID=A0A165EMD1_9NEIS|nr:alpha-ketoacid dehydrogenase subunit beta [Crenobacter luteus]KZE25941.1 2-oxoisovalerate dehydrogenase [Crenobacter luteus]TCP14498.1 pyruvate dehydrogenase E1 component beta subunit [Crenobacter luteus]
MADLTLIEAVNLALARALEDDPDVVLIGQDIGVNGGVFRATGGLAARFGEERVRDTPLAETVIAASAVGMAVEGMKPVAEIQFAGFMYSCFDQLINHAGRLRTRTRGRLTCPMVLRTPVGGGIHAPEHHSESPEGWLAHIPGIKVVTPSTPAAAYGLLLAAIRDPDPVVFLEPTRLYRMLKEPVADDGAALPLGRAFVRREGADITLVSWGATLVEVGQAAQTLAERGVSAEVVDVATLRPLDSATLLASVSKTGRCLIVHEAPRLFGAGAEIAAQVASEALMSLVAPVGRLAGYDTVMPLARLEDDYLPSAARIVAAAEALMAYR